MEKENKCPYETQFLDIDEDLLEWVTGVNQKGAFFCAQAAMRAMVEKNVAGRIIFISSVSAIFGGELQTHYCATKGAVNQLMMIVVTTDISKPSRFHHIQNSSLMFNQRNRLNATPVITPTKMPVAFARFDKTPIRNDARIGP